MRYSQLFGQTLREAPADSPSVGIACLARAAYLRLPSNLLPLGQRVYNQLSALLVTQLQILGGQEISPEANPFKLAETEIQSYRHLPRLLYSCVFPEMRVTMLAKSEETRDRLSKEFLATINSALAQLELPVLVSDIGSIYASNPGGTPLLKCPSCGYLESQEIAQKPLVTPPAETLLPTEKALTPDCPTIESLARYLNLPESKTAKALMLQAKYGDKVEFLFVVVRGDTSLSLPKLKQVIGASEIIPASESQIKAAGAEPGYASPMGLKNVRVIVDQLIPVSPNLVAGANEHGYHLLNTNYGRDYSASLVADLAVTQPGDPCPKCRTTLCEVRGELLVGCEKAPPSDNSVSFTDEQGQSAFVWHGQGRINLTRMLIALAEKFHDEKGLTLPTAIAPFTVSVVVLPGKALDTIASADTIYHDLQSAGISVLYDNRDERAGVKFNDADLIGCPIRITLGERNLQNGMVEFKRRNSQESQLIPLNEIIPHIKSNG